ncbi:hypothetical protein CANCADRAFT_30828 [Tortispora caseinolytica NRRL Y-17796]|uniref:thioredoxin-dependent peroxiredoxin n=1 Tax=Tortispora caseinolytica NRRL Y-17796 TaxID=767744 RepID=A0A1E4TMA1_9ASCO|nr:hypothetical protein CANCADRAFT_30828 [Tortispora caseinolytica NRRL Y-17796]
MVELRNKRKSVVEEPASAAISKRPKTARPEVGKRLEIDPEFTLLDQDGNPVNIHKALAGNLVVIFSYPRASTPGCTKQACGFRDRYPKFTAVHAQIFGISADSPKSQKTFQTKQALPYTLLSDPKRELISKLGAAKSPSGVVRSHWILRDGVFLNVSVGISPADSFEGALKEIQQEQEKQENSKDSGAKIEEPVKSEESVEKLDDSTEKLDPDAKPAPEETTEETKPDAESTVPSEPTDSTA